MKKPRKSRLPKKRYPIYCEHNGARVDFVDKTPADLAIELDKLLSAVESAKRLGRFIKRLQHPAAKAFLAHLEFINTNVDRSCIDGQLAAVCRLNKDFLIGLDMLDMMSGSTIEPLETLRFHMRYSCTHRKRELQQGWNGNAARDLDEQPETDDQ